MLLSRQIYLFVHLSRECATWLSNEYALTVLYATCKSPPHKRTFRASSSIPLAVGACELVAVGARQCAVLRSIWLPIHAQGNSAPILNCLPYYQEFSIMKMSSVSCIVAACFKKRNQSRLETNSLIAVTKQSRLTRVGERERI